MAIQFVMPPVSIGASWGEDLPRSVGIVGNAVEAQVRSHAVPVKGPAGAVEHRRAHGASVEPFIVFLHPVYVPAVGIGVGDEIMGHAVGLGGDAIGVVRDEGISVFLGQPDEIPLHLVQLPGHGDEVFPLFHDAHGGEHVLGRPAGVNLRYVRPCGLDEIGLKGHHVPGTGRVGQGSVLQDFVDAPGKGVALFRRQESFFRIDDVGGLINLAQPEKVIPRCLFGKSWQGARGNQGTERQGKNGFFMGVSFQVNVEIDGCPYPLVWPLFILGKD